MFDKSIVDLRRGLALNHVWLHQAYHEVSAKYKRTVLGSIWISGGMAAYSIALAIVMGGIQGQNLADILPYVMAGIICYSLTGYIMTDAPETYLSAAGIIKNHAYPYTYYSFESVTRIFIVLLHNLIVYFITVTVIGKFTIPHWSILPGLIVVYINSAVWGSLVAMFAARFRDMRFALPFLAQIVFFMTPVFWKPSNFGGWRSVLVNYNPFYGLTEILRSPLMGQAATMHAWALSLGAVGIGLVLWFGFFNAFRGRIAFWV